ncbi:hypothetical protein CS542_08070 [Pedobacter sp. IW39]|nr:hypothetical protein CS542_08070 [Pedobacter sp. IW39]
MGLDYGTSFQELKRCIIPDQKLCRRSLPQEMDSLFPGLLDSALQTCMGLVSLAKSSVQLLSV